MTKRFLIRTVVLVASVIASLDAAAETKLPVDTCLMAKEFRRDPTTGWSWNITWYCHNRVGADLYDDANFETKTAQMRSEPSWFACYRHGATHGGGNDVWYYTLGDISAPSLQRRQPWGFMPAADVRAETHPWPGVPPCPPPAFPVNVKRKSP